MTFALTASKALEAQGFEAGVCVSQSIPHEGTETLMICISKIDKRAVILNCP